MGISRTLLLLSTLFVVLVYSDHPATTDIDIHVWWENNGNIVAVEHSQRASVFGDPNFRVTIVGGNWGLDIINHGDRIEPVQINLDNEGDKHGLFAFFWDLNPPPDVLHKQMFGSRVSTSLDVPVCGGTNETHACPHGVQSARAQCREVGPATFMLEVILLGRGQRFRIPLVRKCMAHSLNHYGSDDWGHLFPPLGFLLYITYTLLTHLELAGPLFSFFIPKDVRRGCRQCKAFFGGEPDAKKIKNDPNAILLSQYQNEQIVFMILGFFLMLILSADVPNMINGGRFPKHFIFGVFIGLSGLFGLLLSTDVLRAKNFAFVSCMIYIYLGFFFLWHEQYTYFAYFMHTIFGYLLIMVGILSWLRYIYPQVTILYCLIGTFASATFIGTDNGLVVYLQPIVTPHHFILLLLNFVVLYMVVVVAAAYIFLRCTKPLPKHHAPLKPLSDYGADEEDGNVSEHEY